MAIYLQIRTCSGLCVTNLASLLLVGEFGEENYPHNRTKIIQHLRPLTILEHVHILGMTRKRPLRS